jgi:rhodanese-related sulfurtransferase
MREDGEWESGHIPGAHHIFVAELDQRGRELDPPSVGASNGWSMCRLPDRLGSRRSTGRRRSVLASVQNPVVG